MCMAKRNTFSNSGFDENISNDSLQIDKRDGVKNILKYIRMDNLNSIKSIFDLQ